MPRRKTLKFTHRQPTRAGQRRAMLVASVTTEGSGWRMTLLDLSPEWLGEEHALAIPEEAPLQGAIAALFRACGIEIIPDSEVDPRQVEGKTVRAVFYTAASGESRIIGFEPCQKETPNESDA